MTLEKDLEEIVEKETFAMLGSHYDDSPYIDEESIKDCARAIAEYIKERYEKKDSIHNVTLEDVIIEEGKK